MDLNVLGLKMFPRNSHLMYKAILGQTTQHAECGAYGANCPFLDAFFQKIVLNSWKMMKLHNDWINFGRKPYPTHCNSIKFWVFLEKLAFFIYVDISHNFASLNWLMNLNGFMNNQWPFSLSILMTSQLTHFFMKK